MGVPIVIVGVVGVEGVPPEGKAEEPELCFLLIINAAAAPAPAPPINIHFNEFFFLTAGGGGVGADGDGVGSCGRANVTGRRSTATMESFNVEEAIALVELFECSPDCPPFTGDETLSGEVENRDSA